MYRVEKDTIISDVMQHAPHTMPLFQQIGMHCMGCAMANGETIEEACSVHDVDADEFVDRLNALLEALESR